MKTKPERVQERTDARTVATPTHRLLQLLRGLQSPATEPVEVRVPALVTLQDESCLAELLNSTSPADRLKLRGLREQIKAILRLNSVAKKDAVDLADAAHQLSKDGRSALEQEWVDLLTANAETERSVRGVALLFSNLQASRAIMKGRIFALPLSATELATDAGQDFLARYLGHYIDRPDSRAARSYILVPGFVGSTEALNRIGKVTHKYRALLVTDAPRYRSYEALRADAADGGRLEALPGDGTHKRHMVVLGNWIKARDRFEGRTAEETDDFFMPASPVWFGLQLHRIVEGKPWLPVAGYLDPLVGALGVEVNLGLDADGFGHALFAKHRVNPIIPKAADSDESVPWGAYSLGGAQVGEAITELIAARYFEYIVNKYGLFNELDEARKIVQQYMSDFMVNNSGPGRMFRAESNAKVSIDRENNTLIVNAHLAYRTVADKAIVRMMRMEQKREAGAKPDIMVEDAA